MTAVPYNLKPKDTKLPAGHDDTLDPPAPPTDAEVRSAPASSWPKVDLSKGSDRAPDPPAGPPPVSATIRSVPPSTYPRSLPEATPNRPVHLAIPVPDIDPDIAFWPVTTLQRWPFTGPPAEGIWPKGWAGIDNTATLYICTVAGEPGTWQAVAGPGTDTGWITVTGFKNGWVAGAPAPRYRKVNGIVYLQGQLNATSATGVEAFDLPAGFQPSTTPGGSVSFIVPAFDNSNAYQASEMFVQANGTGRVIIGTFASSGGTAPTGAAVITCSFPADQ